MIHPTYHMLAPAIVFFEINETNFAWSITFLLIYPISYKKNYPHPYSNG